MYRKATFRSLSMLGIAMMLAHPLFAEEGGDAFSSIPINMTSTATVQMVRSALKQHFSTLLNVEGDFRVVEEGATATRCFGHYVRGQSGNFLWEVNWGDNEEAVDFSNTMAYDGTVFERLRRSVDHDQRGERTLKVLDEEPKWGAVKGAGDGFLADQLDSSAFELQVEGEATVEGESCLVLRVTKIAADGATGEFGRCFLSLDKNLLPIRRESFINGDLFSIDDQLEYDSIAAAEGVAFAVKRLRVRQETDEGAYDSTIFQAENMVMNQELSTSSFSIDWPDGVKVTDEANGVVFVAGEPISDDDLTELRGLVDTSQSPESTVETATNNDANEVAIASEVAPTLNNDYGYSVRHTFLNTVGLTLLLIGCMIVLVGFYRIRKTRLAKELVRENTKCGIFRE